MTKKLDLNMNEVHQVYAAFKVYTRELRTMLEQARYMCLAEAQRDLEIRLKIAEDITEKVLNHTSGK